MAYDVDEDDGSFVFGPLYAGSDPAATIVIDPTQTVGSVALNPDGTIRYGAAGHFDALRAGETGSDSVAYTLTADGATQQYIVPLTIHGENDPPVATQTLAQQRLLGGAAWHFALPSGLFFDAESQPLAYSATQASGAALPDWLSFDQATNSFTGTPPAALQGVIDLVITASDGLAAAVAGLSLSVDPTELTLAADEDGPAVSTGALYAGSDPAAQITIDTTGTTGSVTLNADGTARYAPNDAFEALGAGATGQDGFSVTVVADGVTNTKHYDVTIAGENDAPVATAALPEQALIGGTAWSYTLPGGLFTDIDSSTITYAATLASGDPLPGWLSFDPATHSFAGTPPATLDGAVDLLVSANDGLATTATPLTLAVEGTLLDLATTEDTPSIQTASYRGSDPAAQITLDTTGTVGTVTIDAQGIATYSANGQFETLADGQSAQDHFSVTIVADGTTVIRQYVVTVAGVDDAPVVAGELQPQTVTTDNPLNYALPDGLFTDVDSPTLTYSARLASGAALPAWLTFDAASHILSGNPPATFSGTLDVTIEASDGTLSATTDVAVHVNLDATVIAAPEDGPATVLPPVYTGTDPHPTITVGGSPIGAVTVAADGSVSYNPNGQFESLSRSSIGNDAFTLTVVADGVTTVHKYVVDVDGANDAVVAAGTLTPQYVPTGALFTYTVPAGLFTDVDGDALKLVAYSGGGGALPSWLTFNAATRTFSGIPPAGTAATLDLRVQASDGLTTAKLPFSLIVGDAPVLAHAIADQTTLEDTPFNFQIPADAFFDPNGDTLTYTATRANGDPLLSWMSLDSTGTFHATPPQDFVGTYSIKVIATDPAGNSASSTFRFDVTNVEDAPTKVALSSPWVAQQADHGTIVGILSTIDPDRLDKFSYTLVDNAGGRFALDGDRIIVNAPSDAASKNGIQTITVRSTDAAGMSVDTKIDIKIQKSEYTELFADKTPTTKIWVSTTGDDTAGDGSADHPFATIQNAINHATAGTAIMVHAGTYAEAIALTSGTTDAPIWLISADGAGAAEIKPIAKAEVNAISGRGVQNVVIDGFKITGTDTIGTYGFNLVSINNGAAGTFQYGYGLTPVSNILIKNNIITNWGIDDVHIAQSVGVQVLNNTVSGAHEQGIDFVTATNLLIKGNTVDNITAMTAWKSLDSRQYVGDAGISVKGGSEGVTILNNVVGVNAGYGIKIGGPTDIIYLPVVNGADSDGGHYVNFEVKDALVQGNTILSSTLGAVQVNGSQDVVIDQNRLGAALNQTLFSTINISGYDRSLNLAYDGQLEQLLPGATSAISDDITISNNVYTGSRLYNLPDNVRVVDSGNNVVFNSSNTYAAPTNAWVNGTTGGVSTAYDIISGKASSATASGNDILYGDRKGIASDDYIDGKTGADAMFGGLGDDVYVLENNGDTVHENANGGTDTVLIGGAISLYHMPTPESGDGYVENVVVTRAFNTAIFGNSLDNEIVGGVANDQLKGYGGNDKIYGGAGNDNIDGGVGDDHLYGGDGNDFLYGGDGNGADVLDGGLGKDTLIGGSGDDRLVSIDADTRLDGGYGNDTLYIDRSTATAGYTLDISYFGHGDAVASDPRQIVLPDGTVVKNIEVLEIATGSGNDHIVGGYLADVISTGAGDDYIDGNDGNDRIFAGLGNDTVYGGAGNDVINGNAGVDSLYGGDGNDTIYSLDTDAVVSGGAGTDTLIMTRAGTATPFNVDFSVMASGGSLTLPDGTVISGFEAVTFTGGDGNDMIIGTAGADRLVGAHGDDILYGGDGADSLSGGGENDTLYGGAGADTISGGAGADKLYGGAGIDTFVFTPGQAEGDIIYDFELAGKPNGDKLTFTGYGPGATLTYDSPSHLWVVASADGLLVDHFTIVGVTTMIPSDYSLL